nr:hypothetical protein CFP56_20899 [Quercus suber]
MTAAASKTDRPRCDCDGGVRCCTVVPHASRHQHGRYDGWEVRPHSSGVHGPDGPRRAMGFQDSEQPKQREDSRQWSGGACAQRNRVAHAAMAPMLAQDRALASIAAV